jgi:hypothetical protein
MLIPKRRPLTSKMRLSLQAVKIIRTPIDAKGVRRRLSSGKLWAAIVLLASSLCVTSSAMGMGDSLYHHPRRIESTAESGMESICASEPTADDKPTTPPKHLVNVVAMANGLCDTERAPARKGRRAGRRPPGVTAEPCCSGTRPLPSALACCRGPERPLLARPRSGPDLPIGRRATGPGPVASRMTPCATKR